jgi:hypothetical protein
MPKKSSQKESLQMRALVDKANDASQHAGKLVKTARKAMKKARKISHVKTFADKHAQVQRDIENYQQAFAACFSEQATAANKRILAKKNKHTDELISGLWDHLNFAIANFEALALQFPIEKRKDSQQSLFLQMQTQLNDLVDGLSYRQQAYLTPIQKSATDTGKTPLLAAEVPEPTRHDFRRRQRPAESIEDVIDRLKINVHEHRHIAFWQKRSTCFDATAIEIDGQVESSLPAVAVALMLMVQDFPTVAAVDSSTSLFNFYDEIYQTVQTQAGCCAWLSHSDVRRLNQVQEPEKYGTFKFNAV